MKAPDGCELTFTVSMSGDLPTADTLCWRIFPWVLTKDYFWAFSFNSESSNLFSTSSGLLTRSVSKKTMASFIYIRHVFYKNPESTETIRLWKEGALLHRSNGFKIRKCSFFVTFLIGTWCYLWHNSKRIF